MSILKKIMLLLVTLLAIASVLLFTLDLGFLRGTVEKQVRQATGRDFSINRDLSISLGRELVVRARDVSLGNPDWAESDNFVHAFNIDAVIDTWSLWKGPLLIRQLKIDDLTVNLLQTSEGQSNWEFAIADTDSADTSGQLPFLVEAVTVADANIEFNSPRLDRPVVAFIDLLEQSIGADGLIQASASGRLNDRPMQIELSGGPYQDVLQGDNISLEAHGSFGNITLAGEAGFDNLWNPLQPAVDLRISGPDFKELTDMLGIEGLGSGEMDLSVISEPGDPLTARINGSLGDISLDINTQMPSLAAVSDANIKAKIDGPNFGRIARLAGFEGWPEDRFSIDTSLQRPDKGLEIEQFRLLLARASVNLQGSIPQFPAMANAQFELDISGPDLAPFRKATGLESLPAGAFSFKGTVSSSTDDATQLNVTYEIPLARGAIKGVIGAGEDMLGSDFRLTARGADARALGEFLEIAGLPEAPWTALIDAALNNPGFHDISELSFSTAGLSLEMKGRIGAKRLEEDTDLQFSISGERLADFQAMAGSDLTLPEEPFGISGQVTGAPGAWLLKDVSGNAGSTRFRVNGKLGQGESLAGSDLALEISGTDLGRIFDLPGAARMPEGPFTAASGLVVNQGRLRLKGAESSAGPFSLKLDADLPWPLDTSGGSFSLQTGGANITRILPELAGLELDAKDYEIAADGSWRDGQVSIVKGTARIGDSNLSAQGKIDLPPNLSATDFRLELHSPDLSKLGTVDGARWGTVPLHLVSTFTGTNDKISMEQFQATLGESKVEGSFSMDFEPDVPRFDARFTTNSLSLKPFQVDPVEDGTAQEPEDPDGRFIPDAAFPMEFLKRVDGRFAINAGKVHLKKMTLQNSALTGEVRDGSLLINEIATDGYRGRLVTTLELKPAGTDSASIAASVRAEDLIINLTQQSSQDKEVLPAFNVEIDLAANGGGLREAAATLNGSIRVNSPGGQVKNVRSNSASGLFLAEIISAISPSASKQEVINISCAAAAIKVVDGVVALDPGIALQSDQLNVFAAGRINLASEKIDINFRSKTRKTVDIAASELFSPYVKLSGTLAKPSVALDPKGTLLSGGAAYLSGGLSILAKKALDQMSGTEDPCAEYLEKGPDGG